MISETLSNGKLLPLPWVYVKFQLKRNENVEVYRSDLFSVRFFQQIRRKVPFEAKKRGMVTLKGIDLLSNDLFIVSKFAQTYAGETSLMVYPKLLDSDEYEVPYQKMMGDIVTKRFMMEDAYLLKSIRDYQEHDSFRSINFKASAKAGKWLVNVHEYTISQTVTVLLNMDRANAFYDERVYENSIRMAASIISAFDQDGIPTALISNGKDAFSKDMILVEEGCGEGHIRNIMESLTRLEISLEVDDFAPFLQQVAEEDNQQKMYVLISPFYGDSVIAKFEELLSVHPDSQWILPVSSMDMNAEDFRGNQLTEDHEQITLWKAV